MSEMSFIAEWRKQLAAGQIGVVLVEADHPLEIYVGASDLGHPLVQIRSTAKPKLPEISELVVVDRKESDGHWVLSLSLQDSRFAEVYMRLVAHLVAASRGCGSAAEAWVTVDGILDEWKRLLRFRPVGVLSLDELRGLVGELWLVLNRFAPTSNVEQAVMGWLGPLGAPQDFWYEALRVPRGQGDRTDRHPGQDQLCSPAGRVGHGAPGPPGSASRRDRTRSGEPSDADQQSRGHRWTTPRAYRPISTSG